MNILLNELVRKKKLGTTSVLNGIKHGKAKKKRKKNFSSVYSHCLILTTYNFRVYQNAPTIYDEKKNFEICNTSKCKAFWVEAEVVNTCERFYLSASFTYATIAVCVIP